MKTRLKLLTGIFTFFCSLFVFCSGIAQTSGDLISVSGVVKDKITKRKLDNASIVVPGSNISTVTNIDGEFTIRINASLQTKFVEFSHIGYTNSRLEINNTSVDNAVIFMEPKNNLLFGITVKGDPQMIVEEARAKINVNYCPKIKLLQGFYRETTKKRNNYINISEAVVNVYKTPYDQSLNNDKIQILKGRKLLSQNKNDTLIVKLQGGPNLSVFLDMVKNPELLLNSESLSYYKLNMEEPTIIDERVQYVVSFVPNVIAPYALYYGKFYIDKEDMAFSRIEFNLSIDDKQKATQTILCKKPYNLKFKPEEVSFLVTYKHRVDGLSYLNYIRNEVRFKCDWKKKLFSTTYSIISEMVITDINDCNKNAISNKDSFKSDQSLSDNVNNFYDENFWEAYNIIEPTESLESAVRKLKKHYK